MKTFREMGTDISHVAHAIRIKGEMDDMGMQPLSPNETGGAVSALHSIDVNVNGVGPTAAAGLAPTSDASTSGTSLSPSVSPPVARRDGSCANAPGESAAKQKSPGKSHRKKRRTGTAALYGPLCWESETGPLTSGARNPGPAANPQ